MRKQKRRGVFAGAVLLFACMMSMTAFGKEERTPVGKIHLSFSSDIQAGDFGGTVDVSMEEGECSVDSVDIINEDGHWVGGDQPKVEIWLSADSDYYFKKSGKSAFSFSGDEVKYVSSSAKNDREEMVLVVKLEKLDEDDEDLEVNGLMWDENNGIAHWDHKDLAKNYKVRLCRRGNQAEEDGIGATYTVKENSFNFSEKFSRTGSYYFKVKAVDDGGNGGEWQESPYMEVTEEDLTRMSGQWKEDGRGWWYQNSDGSYTVNNWQYIRGKWYFFDQEGYMKIGWISWGDKMYYCDASGAMLVSTVTPDGVNVGADGAALPK